MTESEASEKACPWGVAPKCVARGCMGWVSMLDEIAGTSCTPIVIDASGERAMTPEDGSCVRVRAALNSLGVTR